jgi:very-short-patch-repair endonuclease
VSKIGDTGADLPSPLVGEGGTSRSEATGEGFALQPPSHRPVAKRIRHFAKNMRHEPTDAERAMWRLLRNRRLSQYEFRRQVPFQKFILDFVCFEKRVVIEIDGSQHAESARDTIRDSILMAEGFRIERCWNNDVLQQPSAVLEDIFAKLAEP